MIENSTAQTIPVWSIPTTVQHSFLELRTNGDLAIVNSATSTAIWQTNTAGHPGDHLTVESTGIVNLITKSGRVIWSNNASAQELSHNLFLRTNQFLTSTNHDFELVMQGDGNLVEYSGSRVVWNSGTAGHPGAFLWMQSNGTLSVRASLYATIWRAASGDHPADHLILQGDGNLVLYGLNDRVVWATYAF